MNIKDCFDSCFYEFQIMIVSFALQEISREGVKNKAIFWFLCRNRTLGVFFVA